MKEVRGIQEKSDLKSLRTNTLAAVGWINYISCITAAIVPSMNVVTSLFTWIVQALIKI